MPQCGATAAEPAPGTATPAACVAPPCFLDIPHSIWALHLVPRLSRRALEALRCTCRDTAARVDALLTRLRVAPTSSWLLERGNAVTSAARSCHSGDAGAADAAEPDAGGGDAQQGDALSSSLPEATRFASLTELSLSPASARDLVRGVELTAVLRVLAPPPALRRVRLAGWPAPYMSDLYDALPRWCPHLEELVLEGVALEVAHGGGGRGGGRGGGGGGGGGGAQSAVGALASLARFRALSVWHAVRDPPRPCPNLSPLTQLTALQLAGVLPDAATCEALAALRGLQHLRLDLLHEGNEVGVKVIDLSHHTRLTSLVLRARSPRLDTGVWANPSRAAHRKPSPVPCPTRLRSMLQLLPASLVSLAVDLPPWRARADATWATPPRALGAESTCGGDTHRVPLLRQLACPPELLPCLRELGLPAGGVRCLRLTVVPPLPSGVAWQWDWISSPHRAAAAPLCWPSACCSSSSSSSPSRAGVARVCHGAARDSKGSSSFGGAGDSAGELQGRLAAQAVPAQLSSLIAASAPRPVHPGAEVLAALRIMPSGLLVTLPLPPASGGGGVFGVQEEAVSGNEDHGRLQFLEVNASVSPPHVMALLVLLERLALGCPTAALDLCLSTDRDVLATELVAALAAGPRGGAAVHHLTLLHLQLPPPPRATRTGRRRHSGHGAGEDEEDEDEEGEEEEEDDHADWQTDADGGGDDGEAWEGWQQGEEGAATGSGGGGDLRSGSSSELEEAASGHRRLQRDAPQRQLVAALAALPVLRTLCLQPVPHMLRALHGLAQHPSLCVLRLLDVEEEGRTAASRPLMRRLLRLTLALGRGRGAAATQANVLALVVPQLLAWQVASLNEEAEAEAGGAIGCEVLAG